MPAFDVKSQSNGVYMTELLKKVREDRRIEHILLDVNEGNVYYFFRCTIKNINQCVLNQSSLRVRFVE